MFRFVSTDGVPSKRHQVSKACDSCRRRKKRCLHATPPATSSAQSRPEGDEAALPQSPPPTASPTIISPAVGADQQVNQTIHQRESPQTILENPKAGQQGPDTSATDHSNAKITQINAPPREGNLAAPRFIGDLSPESIFLAATSPDATRGASNNSVGVWLTSNLNERESYCPSKLFYASGSLVQKVLVPMLEQECLSVLPAPAHLGALSRLYFEKVQSIFPVVEEATYYALSPTDHSRILLQQGVCLAASKNFGAKQHLFLPDSLELLSCRDFGNKVSGAMRLAIEMGLVDNKISVIQILALLSQFTDSPVGEDISSQYCGRAVHNAQSLGLHVQGRQEGQVNEFHTTLLCCVWAIDRLNAALYGRPVMMHERDIRMDFESCLAAQQPTFRLFLQIIQLLDRVISLYRPTQSSVEGPHLEWTFPAFEDIVISSGANIGASTLATLEILYHSIAILSCRSKAWIEPQRSSMPFLRQSLSTSILCSTTRRDLQGQIVLFPFIPYSLSMALSMVYKEMRHTKLSLQRDRSRAQFQTICETLSELEGVFWSAHTTSDMGQKLLKEMDRVYSQVSSSDRVDVEQPGNQQIQDFDHSLFDSIRDIDLFDMFDPTFDLDGFDACLEGTAFPMGVH